MLEAVMDAVHNHFEVTRVRGVYRVEGGAVVPVGPQRVTLLPGQFYRVSGSVLNDGVHREGDVLEDEPNFYGWIAPMAVPRAFLDLVAEIEAWHDKNGAPGAYQAESFDGYSYTRATGEDGQPVDWRSAFRKALNPYRRLS